MSAQIHQDLAALSANRQHRVSCIAAIILVITLIAIGVLYSQMATGALNYSVGQGIISLNGSLAQACCIILVNNYIYVKR